MPLKLYNTLTNQIEDFVPITPGKVGLYTCGPTVYNFPHIGNWAAYIYWDILVRILIANDYDVTRVMNITDVGQLTSDADEGQDKLEKGAKREGKNAWEVAKFYTDDFINGMKRLGMIIPQHYARATDFIGEQTKLIRTLKEKGYTYQTSDGIYFDSSKFKTYADFAHLDLKGQKAGARVDFNPEKKNISDFALWKFTPKDEKRDMEWATPEDLLDNDSKATIPTKPKMGFPGWHIECSAISMNFLGNTIDIHTGGIDHLPIHHTNEIAQSEAATGVKFSNYWLHCNFIKVNNTKISKSLNNGYTLDDLEARGFNLDDYRMLILQGHYRSEGNFTFDNLTASKNRLANWRNVAAIRHQIHDSQADDKELLIMDANDAAIEAVNNDLGTPEALKIIDEIFSRISVAPLSSINKDAFNQLLETIDSILGLQLVSSSPDISDDIKQIIISRNQARAQKDWKESDKLRDRLESAGITLRDTGNSCVWEYKNV